MFALYIETRSLLDLCEAAEGNHGAHVGDEVVVTGRNLPGRGRMELLVMMAMVYKDGLEE